MSRRTEDRIVSLKNKMASFVSHRESFISVHKPLVDNVLFSSGYEQFFAIGVLQFDGQSWKTYWFEKNIQTVPSIAWFKDYEPSLLKAIPFDTLQESHFLHLKKENSNSVFGFAFPVTIEKNAVAVIVALFGPETMSDLVADFKGDMNEVYLLDNKGFIFAHPSDDRVGQFAANTPQDMKEVYFTGESKNEQGDTLVTSYRRVEGSNLYAVASIQKDMAFTILEDLFWQTLAIGLGFIILAFVFASFFAKKFTQSFSEIKSILTNFRRGQFQVKVNANDEIGELEDDFEDLRCHLINREKEWDHEKEALAQKERTSAFEELSGRLANEIKSPLLGILGHAQLAKMKANGEFKKHVEIIEQETRKVRELIESLIKFARLEKVPFSRVDLHQVLNRILNFVNHQFLLKGIKLYKHFESTSEVYANVNQLEYVLLNLMMNASQAVENSDQKEIHIYLRNIEDKKCVQLKIQDTGPGMSAEVKERIFEPLFTDEKSSFSDRRGIGLSASLGIMKNHKAKFYVESDMGSGTAFFIELPFCDFVSSLISEKKDKLLDKNKEVSLEENFLHEKGSPLSERTKEEPVTLSPGSSIQRHTETSDLEIIGFHETQMPLSGVNSESEPHREGEVSEVQSSLSVQDWSLSQKEKISSVTRPSLSHALNEKEDFAKKEIIDQSKDGGSVSGLGKRFSKPEGLQLTEKEENELRDLKNQFFLKKFHVKIRKPRIKD